jgi:predicted DNA binding CopG/RHH family protein
MVLKSSDKNRKLMEEKVQKSGLKKKETNDARIFMAISNTDKEIIERYAADNGLSLAAAIRYILNQWMKDNNLK